MRRFIGLIIAFIYFFFFPVSTHAEGEFLINSTVTYSVNETKGVHVVHDITLENTYPTLYAKSYSLDLINIKPKDVKALYNGEVITNAVSDNQGTLTITVEFPDSLVGKGAKRNFQIEFDVDSFTEKNGEVWEVSIPKLGAPENFRSYNVVLKIPKSFGDLSYITPDPQSRSTNDSEYVFEFNKEAVSASGIKAGFGQFQVFSYTLNYHLENPLNSDSDVEIALPPDTAFQKIYIDNLNPKPAKIEVDEDGNWIATYKLTRRQRLDVLTSGTAQLFASPREIATTANEVLAKNLLPQTYWESESPEIVGLARQYKTAREIYNFVIDKLSYDYDRVKPNVQRLGALEVLKNPASAICMEFTDLFIAISRAAGIPAREVNGYAYTENPEIKPLSMVSDVLHAWPEYWDSTKKLWIPVDPTWQDTTGGADFFNKLDLRHFTFVVHGVDSTKPYAPGSYKLGANPQKDVFVNFGHLSDNNSTQNFTIKAKVVTKIPLLSYKIAVEVINNGGAAVYNKDAIVYFDNQKRSTHNFGYLLPFTSKEYTVDIPFSLLGLKTPQTITVSFMDQTTSLPGTKSVIIVSNLIVVFVLVIVIFLVAIIRSRRLRFAFARNFLNVLNTKFTYVIQKLKVNPFKKG